MGMMPIGSLGSWHDRFKTTATRRADAESQPGDTARTSPRGKQGAPLNGLPEWLGSSRRKERIMRAHYLQHDPCEGLGSIESWLQAAGYTITGTRFFESASLPVPDEIDFLIIMGGPMSVNDEEEFPWLVDEKQFIRHCIERDKPVLGICLGAQLIASALGARVYPNHTKEIGWFPIQAVATTSDAVYRLPPIVDVFHWHGETFDLPPGAMHLARSDNCENQAFQLGRFVIGLQFHLEVTPELVREMVVQGRSELVPAGAVQSAETILAAPPEKYQAINRLMEDILAFLRRAADQ